MDCIFNVGYNPDKKENANHILFAERLCSEILKYFSVRETKAEMERGSPDPAFLEHNMMFYHVYKASTFQLSSTDQS